MISCIDLDNFSLTGHYSRYNEDSLTAQQLLIRCVRKTKETTETLTSISEGIDGFLKYLRIAYDEGNEELTVHEEYYITTSIRQNLNRYFFLFQEDGKSAIELAGNVNKVINEGLTLVAELITKLSVIAGIEDKLKELQTYLDGSYLDVYDECSYTVLELAGNTGKYVNDYITVVNMLITIVDYVNNSELSVDYTDADEMLVTVVADADNNNEILEL